MTSSSSSSPEILGVTSQDHFSYKHATHEEVLEDLSSRFILNLPDDELSSLERICFQVEQAHWFYEDFIREENPKFPSLPLKRFSAMLFHACPLLHQWSHDHEQAFNTFMQYKTRVPVCGAIMLNDTWEKCLLVKGWKSSSGWGFPKGKINQVEPPASCAIREVLEETGYNLAGQINPDNVIEMSIKEQKISLFIVPGVPEDYPFKTKTRKEISKIEWFRLTDLPTWKRNKTAAGRFYLISPFIGALKAFINERKPRVPRKAPWAKKAPPAPRNEQPYFIAKGVNRESSSQSSSAENGDPQTPSPRSSEPFPAIPRVANGSPKLDPAAVTMDPHFAHLLSALAISASASDSKSHALPPSNTLPLRGHENTDAPVAIPSTEPHTSPNLVASIDWSASVPQCQESSSSQHDTSSLGSVTPSGHSLLPLPQTPQSSMSSSGASDYDHPSIGSMLASSDVPSRRITSRTSSRTTDFSPYLSSPTAPSAPVADRSKQHIALLEAVSAESARLMQAYKTAAANGIAVNVRDNFKYSMAPGYPPTASTTSHITSQPNGLEVSIKYSGSHDLAVVPPGSQDPRVLYTSTPSLSSGLGQTAASRNTASRAMCDPSQVRPRTSLSYHRDRGLMNPNQSGSASMNQSQLLAVMNGPITHPLTPYGSYAQPPQNREPPLPPFHTPVLQGQQLPFYPPQSLPHQISGPLAPLPTNNTLLSILNNGRVVSNISRYPPTPIGR